MDFREREGDFQGADRRYAELTRQRDTGSISEEEFDTQRQRLMVRDDEGRWWAKLGESGEWHYRDGKTWVRGTPPAYREEVVSEPTNYFEEVDRRYVELKGLFEGGEITEEEFDEQLKRSMVQDERGRWWSKSRKTGEWHYHDGSAWVRGTPPGYQPPRITRAGLVGMAALLGMSVLAGIIIWILVSYLQGGNATEEGPKPEPGYQLVKHDSGNLSVEVPSDWEGTLTGKDGTFEGEDLEAGEGVGPAITATPDLFAWENVFNATAPGTYIVASREAAQEYTEDELVDSGFNDRSKARCDATRRKDFQRSSYSGRIQTWQCENDSTFTTLAAAPEGRQCVVMLMIRTYSEDDRKAAQHILDTFEADCARIS